jgi:hypothetical protein
MVVPVRSCTPALPLRCATGTLCSPKGCFTMAGGARENAHLFHDLKDMPEIERLVHLRDLEELFEQLMH